MRHFYVSRLLLFDVSAKLRIVFHTILFSYSVEGGTRVQEGREKQNYKARSFEEKYILNALSISCSVFSATPLYK